jgi:transcriptional regulator with XRE-family HTH domain
MKYTTPSERVAAEIRAELARQEKPQLQLAELLGISQVSISRRLRGQTAIDVNELSKIAEYLGVPMSQFLPELAA